MKLLDCLDLIKVGDIGLTTSTNLLGTIINKAQKLGGGDDAKYVHTFIVVSLNGQIAESSRTISYNHLKDYVGSEVCIFRHKEMTPFKFEQGMLEVKDNIGMIYPVHRLFLHLFDSVNQHLFTKYLKRDMPWKWSEISCDWPVCSELAMQFLLKAKICDGLPADSWQGVVPDDFDDVRNNNPNFWVTIGEGVLEDG